MLERLCHTLDAARQRMRVRGRLIGRRLMALDRHGHARRFLRAVRAAGPVEPVPADRPVRLRHRSAVVWSGEQVVEGQVQAGLRVTRGHLLVNGRRIAFDVRPDGTFSVPVFLTDRVNRLVARIRHGGRCLESQRLRLVLGDEPRPEIWARAEVEGRTVTLRAEVLANPRRERLAFAWRAAQGNPGRLLILNASRAKACCRIPADARPGEYAFDLAVRRENRPPVRARALVSVQPGGEVRAFDIRTDRAAWIDRAVVYQVTPYTFVHRGTLADVTAKLPELAELGCTVVYLQPICATARGGQGHDIVDYFRLRADYGTEADLHRLVAAAHARGMRVLLDFVANHTSVEHPYARHVARHGRASPYWDFYQHAPDAARFAEHYRRKSLGKADFVHYFDWEDLANLDLANPQVERWLIAAMRYWVERFDVDGFRMDAAWAISARAPQFVRRCRFALKRLKPELLLLGEDQAAAADTFEGRFDAAYDWAADEGWVSRWAWQTGYHPHGCPTIFNHAAPASRAAHLRAALTNGGRGFSSNGKVLRFLENADLPRFIAQHKPHELARTRMAAALLMCLPGIPMLYNGQEIGYELHPYWTPCIFRADASIRALDRHGLFDHYRRLIALRSCLPSLYGERFQELAAAATGCSARCEEGADAGLCGCVFAFRRWEGQENVVVVLNTADRPLEAAVALPADLAGAGLIDLLTGDRIPLPQNSLGDPVPVRVPLPAYTTRALLVQAPRPGLPAAARA